MSEQSKILAEMQQLVMNILKTGSATVEDGQRLDELEELMLKQKCYKETENSDYSYIGEEIASLFFINSYNEAVNKMYENGITPEDFFGFAQYHYEDEPSVDMFTNSFMADVVKAYEEKSEASK
jgi:hypothetical protein